MATEYILVAKHKYEKLEIDAKNNEMGEFLSQRPEKEIDSSGNNQNDGHQLSTTNGKESTSTTTDDDGDVSEHDTKHRDEDSPQGEDLEKGKSDMDYDFGDNDVLDSFSEKELQYVEPIILLMKKEETVMTWNKNTGEIILLGNAVDGSNVIELLKDTLTGQLHPAGKMEFLRGLDLLKVNMKCLKNTKYKNLLRAIKGNSREQPTIKKKIVEENKSILDNVTKKAHVMTFKGLKKYKGWLSWD